jgi:hypothetical protein
VLRAPPVILLRHCATPTCQVRVRSGRPRNQPDCRNVVRGRCAPRRLSLIHGRKLEMDEDQRGGSKSSHAMYVPFPRHHRQLTSPDAPPPPYTPDLLTNPPPPHRSTRRKPTSISSLPLSLLHSIVSYTLDSRATPSRFRGDVHEEWVRRVWGLFRGLRGVDRRFYLGKKHYI